MPGYKNFKNMEIFSDEISEQYQKYIIQLKLPVAQTLYLL